DLLRAQGEERGGLGGQGQRLVAAVGVERLRATEHSRQRLQRHAHHVVVRLLRGQGGARRLRVEAEHLRARILRAEALLHDARPYAPRRAELGDLLEQVVVDVEEEGEATGEAIDVEAA